MRARKTIKVSTIKNSLNGMLEQDIGVQSKATICCILENILMDTGNYHGFRFDMPTDEAKEVTYNDETYYDRTYY